MIKRYKITTYNGKPQSYTLGWNKNQPIKLHIESGDIYELTNTQAYAMKKQSFFDYDAQINVYVFNLEEIPE